MLFLRTSFYLLVACSLLFTCDLHAKKKKKKKKTSVQKIIPKHFKAKNTELKQIFTGETPAWELTAEAFEKEWGTIFRWLNKEKKKGARFHAVNNPNKLTLFGMRVWEAVIRFKDGKIEKLDVSLYNRGDAQVSVRVTGKEVKKTKMDATQFKALIKDSDTKVNEWLQVKGKALPARKLVGGSNDLIYEKYWVKGEQCAGFQWSITKLGKTFDPEYMKFIYSKFDSSNDPRKLMTRNKNMGKLSKAKNIKDNVTKNEEGFTYIDNIPMVDQGPKGYCAVATIERILKYYGSQADQHQIAQVVDTKTGTDPVRMLKMLKKAAPKLGIKIYSYLDPPDFSKPGGRDTRDYIRQIGGFNKFLKKEKAGSVPLAFPIIASARDSKLALFKEYKCVKKKTDFKKFKSNIKKSIDRGIPVAWALFLGYVPEGGKTPQSRGGHMRLIIGYNKDMSKLVFSDTWGAGHEFKTINTDDAWIVTTFYGIFKPSKK